VHQAGNWSIILLRCPVLFYSFIYMSWFNSFLTLNLGLYHVHISRHCCFVDDIRRVSLSNYVLRFLILALSLLRTFFIHVHGRILQNTHQCHFLSSRLMCFRFKGGVYWGNLYIHVTVHRNTLLFK